MSTYDISLENIFEHLFGWLGTASEPATAQSEFESEIVVEMVKRDLDGPAAYRKLTAAAKKQLSETMIGQWSQMTPAEQKATATEYVRSNCAMRAELNQKAAPPPYLGN